MSISGLKGELWLWLVWKGFSSLGFGRGDSLVIVDEKTFHNEDMDPSLLHVGLTGLGWQADAVGAGKLDRVLLPSSHRVDHGLHVQGVDHWYRTGEKTEDRASPHKPPPQLNVQRHTQFTVRQSVYHFMTEKSQSLGLIGYQTREKNMQERKNTLLQGFPTWNPILPSHCLKPSSPTSIWSGLWNNSHQ